jgi:hypothetical protein
MAIKRDASRSPDTGRRQDTLIERVLTQVPATLGGFLTKEVRKCGHRVGFALVDLASGRNTCPHVGTRAKGLPLGAADIGVVERIGVRAILRAVAEASSSSSTRSRRWNCAPRGSSPRWSARSRATKPCSSPRTLTPRTRSPTALAKGCIS